MATSWPGGQGGAGTGGRPEASHDLHERINQELYKRNAELAVRNKTLALLRKLDEISLAAVTPHEMAEKITQAIAEALGYELVSIAVVDEKQKILKWLDVSSVTPWITEVIEKPVLKHLRLPLSSSMPSVMILQEENVTYVTGLEKVFPKPLVDALMDAPESYEESVIKYSLLYPLRFGNQTLGLLTLSTSRSLENMSQYEQESATGIVGLVSLALYKAKIYQDLQITSAELASANKQLQDLDKLKSEVMSIVSHQLYTPLTALRGYVSMLKEGDFGKVPEKQDYVLDILDTSATRLIDLIKGLLDISRIERGKLELNLESADLGKVANDLVRDLLPNAQKKHLALTYQKAEKHLPHVVIDVQRIRQVMLNFVDNAIKYTDEGKIEVSVKQDGEILVFSVADTGKGLTKEEIEKLFTKFTRVGGASRYHTEGAGLGLYVAKQIVKEHHGKVQVASAGAGKGSTFSVKLPIEGSPRSLKLSEKTTVEMRAAESGNHKGRAAETK